MLKIKRLALRPIPRSVVPAQSSYLTLLFSSPTSFHSNNDLDSQRKANLGSMVDYIRKIVPEALHVVPDSARLDKDIILRVSPTITPNVPMIKGTVSYLTALKATQLIFTSFVLASDVKLHITDIKVDEDGSLNYGLFKGSSKIVVKWSTCGDGCEHLLHRPIERKAVEPSKFESWNRILKALKIMEDGHEVHVHKIMSGIFIFELNKDNDKILVHNVENVEMVNKQDIVDDMGNFATG